MLNLSLNYSYYNDTRIDFRYSQTQEAWTDKVGSLNEK